MKPGAILTSNSLPKQFGCYDPSPRAVTDREAHSPLHRQGNEVTEVCFIGDAPAHNNVEFLAAPVAGDQTSMTQTSRQIDTLLRVPSNDEVEDFVISVWSLFQGASSVSPNNVIQNSKKITGRDLLIWAKNATFQIIFMSATVQPVFNTGAASVNLLGSDCDVGDQLCYFSYWRNGRALFTYNAMFCSWYANYRTMLEYSPEAFADAWKLILNPAWTIERFKRILTGSANDDDLVAVIINREWTFERVIGVSMGVLSAVASLVLNLEALTACEKIGAWGFYVDKFMVGCAVLSTLFSRVYGSKNVIKIARERLLAWVGADYFLAHFGYADLATFYRHRRYLLMALSDLYTYEYMIPQNVIQSFHQRITDENYNDAFRYLYKGEEQLHWDGLLAAMRPSYLGKFLYYGVIFLLTVVCAFSYFISYNLTEKAFPGEAWGKASYFIAFPNTCFYLLSLLFSPDQFIRSFTLSRQFVGKQSWQRWVGFTSTLYITAFSSLNLVYSASNQAKSGDYDMLKLIFGLALQIFFMCVGAIISALCNYIPISKIDMKYADEERFVFSTKLFKELDNLILGKKSNGEVLDNVVAAQKNAVDPIKEAYDEYQIPWHSFSTKQAGCFFCNGKKDGYSALSTNSDSLAETLVENQQQAEVSNPLHRI